MKGTFRFDISGQTTPVDVSVGYCSLPVQLPAGKVTVTEEATAGTAVSAINVIPSTRKVSTDLAARTATVMIVAGDSRSETVVSFRNRPVPQGALNICKVAGTDVAPGTPFTFTVGSQSVSVQAGKCVQLTTTFPVGTNQTIQEQFVPGIRVTAIGVNPTDRLVGSPDLGMRKVTVRIDTGVTTVTYTNAKVFGRLELCKVVGSDIAASTAFTFTVGTRTVSVPAGKCLLLSGQIPVDTQVTIQEQFVPGMRVTAIGVNPANRLVGSADLANRKVTVRIGAGVTAVTYTNARMSGQLQICKVVGPDVAASATFTFTVGTQKVGVPAGKCVTVNGSFPVDSQQTIQEQFVPGMRTTTIAVSPTDRLVGSPDLGMRKVTVRIDTGVTTVTYTNAKVFGRLEICKVAGDGIASGTSFTFMVGNRSITVPAGSCVLLNGTLPVDTQVTIEEQFVAGVRVTAIGVNPADRRIGSDLAKRIVTVRIGNGVTVVTYTNARVRGRLAICKVAGKGIVAGTAFTFSVDGRMILCLPANV